MKIKIYILLILGHVFLLLGIVGAVLPLLPTTPFLLLAAYCYSKSSNKFHTFIINHKYFGPPINDWRRNGVINLKVKILATIMLSLVIFLRLPKLQIAFAFKSIILIVLFLVLIFIWSRPSKSNIKSNIKSNQ